MAEAAEKDEKEEEKKRQTLSTITRSRCKRNAILQSAVHSFYLLLQHCRCNALTRGAHVNAERKEEETHKRKERRAKKLKEEVRLTAMHVHVRAVASCNCPVTASVYVRHCMYTFVHVLYVNGLCCVV